MKIFWISLLFSCGVAFLWGLFTSKWSNVFTLTFVFGKKGSGKSTYLCKKAIHFLKKGWYVYTNMDDLVLPSVRHIQIDDLDIKHLPPARTLIILDEVGMVWDARRYKSFRDEVRDFFKLQRHAKCRVIIASQTFDIDKKIRDLTDDMILCQKWFSVFSVARHINKHFVLTEAAGDSESRIAENLSFAKVLFFPRVELSFIPRYAPFFNSFSLPAADPLRYREDKMADLSEKGQRKFEKMLRKKNKRYRSHLSPAFLKQKKLRR